MIEKLNERLFELWNARLIEPKDLTDISNTLDISRFTVSQYARGNGKSKNTAEQILKEFHRILAERKELAEKSDVLADYLNND